VGLTKDVYKPDNLFIINFNPICFEETHTHGRCSFAARSASLNEEAKLFVAEVNGKQSHSADLSDAPKIDAIKIVEKLASMI